MSNINRLAEHAHPLSPAPVDHWVTVRPGHAPLRLHVREWAGGGRPVALLHGLSSNARTWDGVALRLAQGGHRVVAVDQRGHGLSDKPATGYDFAHVVEDLVQLLDTLALVEPVVAGQSWGGNVVLAFGALHPLRAHALVFVDGGFIDLQLRPEATWERIAVELRPPSLTGLPRSLLQQRIQAGHPTWDAAGVEATLGNFETLADGTVQPWLSLDRHLQILRALWEQRPAQLYPLVQIPVTVAVAEDRSNPAWMAVKQAQVAAAQAGLTNATVHWFSDADHDIHVQRPAELAALIGMAAAPTGEVRP